MEYCRIHASGDFDSLENVNLWCEIVGDCKNTRFWTYTKRVDFESAFDNYDNANIVRSIIPGIGFNFGTCEYILNAYKELLNRGESVYICRCGVDKNQHCNTCKGCSVNKYVLFIEHSTSYIAEKDPLYETVKTIIESQKKPE